MLTLGDGTAKIIGKTFGKTAYPYNKAKKLEGTLAGVMASTLGCLIFISPFKAIMISIVSMLIESIPLPINDNIVIPLIAGSLLVILP
jgi:dolichol kinase